jgi:hypothetical protein
MQPTVSPSSPPPPWEELSSAQTLNTQHLDDIKAHLDLILLALEALTQMSSDVMIAAANHLNLGEVMSDRVDLWRLRQSNPLGRSSGGRKKLDGEEARSLVLMICYLAKQHQELIRRAVTLLEQMTLQGQNPYRTALLGDYLDNFVNLYPARMETENNTTINNTTLQHLTPLAYKLLLDLLFYSAEAGHRRLWLVLTDYAQ